MLVIVDFTRVSKLESGAESKQSMLIIDVADTSHAQRRHLQNILSHRRQTQDFCFIDFHFVINSKPNSSPQKIPIQAIHLFKILELYLFYFW